MLPNTLLCVKIDSIAILIDPPSRQLACKLGGVPYSLPYNGYTLQIYCIQWRNIESNIKLVMQSLGQRATLAILQ